MVVVLVGLCCLLTSASAWAAGDDVKPEEDNPAGCTLATGEDNDGCGAQGRDHFGNAGHKPPVEACADSTAPSGSRITRITPDGPRRDDGSLAFISGACVYLPPGYQTSGLSYPVMHLLHGGGGDEADWVTFGQIQGILDRAYQADPKRAIIAVMPDGRSGQWYDYEDSSFRIETYVLDYLVPYVDRHFRTIPDRSARAVVGLSNGGYGALHFAGKRPDFFVTAGGMSSNLGARTMSGLGEDGAVHYQGSVPFQLAENYDGVDLVLDVANSCTDPDPLCATIAVDLAFTPDHVAVQQRMGEVGHKGAFDMRQADGAHQYKWWSKWLEERQLPFVQERLADPHRASAPVAPSSIPAEFRYRSIKPHFFVWGYEVRVQRDVREFLDLRAVKASGFEVQGSGRATVVTAGRYDRNRTYNVAGAGPTDATFPVVADERGRLAIDVDLGPSHTSEQFTNSADVAEATGDYWTARTITITGADGTPVPDDVRVAAPVPGSRGSGTAFSSSGTGPANPGAATDTLDAAAPDGDRPLGQQAAAANTAVEPGPQLIPTLLFIALLLAGAGFWWRRRQHRLLEEAS